MQLFRISFGLLFYANLAHAVDLYSDGTGLASAPVDNIEGARCTDEGWVDASKELRESKVCKEGDKGLTKQAAYLTAVVKMDDFVAGTPNKPYMCCVKSTSLCRDGKIEVVVEKDSTGKERNVPSSCSNSKPCQDPKNNFCLQEAAKDPNHSQRDGLLVFDNYLENLKDMPICCKKHNEEVPGVPPPPPVTEPPKTKPPTTKPPKTKPPKTKPPKTKPPVTKPPVTKPPVTEPPKTKPSKTKPPVTKPPVTEPPVTEPPKNTPPENKPTVTQPPENPPPENPPPSDQPPENSSPESPSSATSSLPLFPLLIFFLLME